MRGITRSTARFGLALLGLSVAGCRTRLLGAPGSEGDPGSGPPDTDDFCQADYSVSNEGGPLGSPVDELAVGDHFTCARVGGDVICWGYNQAGQLGDGTLSSRSRPARTPMAGSATSIATGPAFDVCGGHRMGHTCARLADGSVACWGANLAGSDSPGDDVPATPNPTVVAGLSGVLDVAVGGWHNCAGLADGSAECWGEDRAGELGDGSPSRQPKGPTPVLDLANVVQIVVGEAQSCALLRSGSVSCWGDGTHGEIGDGGLTSHSTPVAVTDLSDAVQIAGAWGETCAIRSDHTVVCWGFGIDDKGLLGVRPGTPTGPAQHQPRPVQVVGLANVVQLALADWYGCAVLGDGTVECWGAQRFTRAAASPTPPTLVTGLVDIVEVKTARDHACARDRAGGVWCWGANFAGQIGDGTTTHRYVPVRVP